MTQALLGDRVWDDVEPWLDGHTHLDAAIAYVGSTAGQVLTPAPGLESSSTARRRPSPRA